MCEPDFTVLQPTELEQISNEGSIRKWIEGKGKGQMVRWAGSIVQLLQRKNQEWEEVKILGRDMKGKLPEGWALEFSGGKVVESRLE
ncbi:hypothetical protein FJTKL_06746 [Diaporthe vaccinii]|uniref:Uncharacterized protein n=1 Tax=Diaporthe vaccinii TaxID=105482 RepID=A0ABR4DPV5_9PEZI